MGEVTRIFCPAFLSLSTISHTRALILAFDFQCLAVFFLMFLIDPNPHLRIYFMFYISLFTLPTAYVVVFGDRIWMRVAFVCQLTRMVFIGFHNVFYPIFVAAYIAIGYENHHPGTTSDEILMHSTSYGEPAKLFQIYRLQMMLKTTPDVSVDGSEVDLEDDKYESSVTKTETETIGSCNSGDAVLVNNI
ncbi:Serpentine Receptor, class H [Caenorhabditis elegans]|uniref:Serpentine Receptor, class H n=1 Tax=Caenorhabditis elegans TaxID=6239 RepID=Q21510_CAEEL|nr:Serpentine Receptor, class H [Caenorhabditis elegans]CAA83613.1 Serpentine Receptor, class H [Caenorhabditis elegans]|eukprot:NP_499226.1 Uncharacterized protein CELE_M04D8.5 [Caenorhabditis elegans]